MYMYILAGLPQPQHLFFTKVFVKNTMELGLLIRVNSECKFFCKSNVSYYL